MKEIKAIELQVKPKRHLGLHDDYFVMLNGVQWGEIYYNTRGYVGYLPSPPKEIGGKVVNLTIGEVSLTKYKQEIAKLNAEWKQYSSMCLRAAALEALTLVKMQKVSEPNDQVSV